MALASNRPGRKLNEDGEIELTDLQEQFVEWLIGDRPEGESQATYAARLGVAPSTLTAWKRDRAFKERWEVRMRETHAHPDKLSKLLDVTYQRALSGDMKAVELYHRLVDRMSPERIEHVSTTEGVEQLSDEQLEAEITKAAGVEKDRRLKAV